MEKLLVELLNATLCKRPLNEKVFEGSTEADWQRCFDMALQQNVLAMTFPAMSSLPKDLRPSFTLWSKWMAYAQSITEQSQYKRMVVEKMGSWLDEDGLSTTILKGFSLSALYPNPNLREFSDIDIFSCENFYAVNACFANHGVLVDSVDGHHAYLKLDGVFSIEHHFAFTNTKVKHGLKRPEEALQYYIRKDQQKTNIQGVFFPCKVFTALEVGNHAYGHFLQEKIELRHLIDWVLALHLLSDIEAELVSDVKSNTKWGKFDDTLTAIAIHKLGLPKDWFPAKELEAANSIDETQEQRVMNDMMISPHTPKGCNSNHRRVNIAKRILKNSWKFRDYSNISATQLLIKETVGHFKTINLKTDHKL